MRVLTLALTLLCSTQWGIIALHAQEGNIPVNTWRTHFSYQQARHIAIAPSTIYCATEHSLFSLDLPSGAVEPVTKLNGISRQDIAAIAWHEATSQLLIAYQEGTLDLWSPSTLVSNTAIRDAQVGNRPKAVRSINFFNNRAYLTLSFGVVVIDLNSAQVIESYQDLGPNGSPIELRTATIKGDSLLLASANEVLSASLISGDNLRDFATWTRKALPDSLQQGTINAIASSGALTLVGIEGYGIASLNASQWNSVYQSTAPIYHASSSSEEALFTVGNTLISITPNQAVQELENSSWPKPRASYKATDGVLWVADDENGLVSNQQGTWESYFPSGPCLQVPYRIKAEDSILMALGGALSSTGLPSGQEASFSTFDNGSWSNYTLENTPGLNGWHDLIDVTYNPQDQHYYIVAAQEGLLVWDGAEEFTQWNSSTPSSWQNLSPLQISAITSTSTGELWLTLQGTDSLLHQYSPITQSWTAYSLPQATNFSPLTLTITAIGDIWMPLAQGSSRLLVLNPYEADLPSRLLNTSLNNGGLPSQNINSLASDREGRLWLGTDDGLVYFAAPSLALSGSEIDAIKPIFEQRPLFDGDVINVILIDGGDRKWVGTNDGLWLFEDDANVLVKKFDIENSPMPSNVVTDLAINPYDGELFVLTSTGLVSYRSAATQGSNTHSNVQAFPNPIRRNLSTQLTISGLPTDAEVKITDAAGKLVVATVANGGTASWDLYNADGQSATPGVYFIFSTSTDGTDTLVSKVIVLE